MNTGGKAEHSTEDLSRPDPTWSNGEVRQWLGERTGYAMLWREPAPFRHKQLVLEDEGDQLILREGETTGGWWTAIPGLAIGAVCVGIVGWVTWRKSPKEFWFFVIAAAGAAAVIGAVLRQLRGAHKPESRVQPGAMYNRAHQKLRVGDREFDISTVVRVERVHIVRDGCGDDGIVSHPEIMVCVRVAPGKLEWVFVGEDCNRLGEWVERKFAIAMGVAFVRIKITA